MIRLSTTIVAVLGMLTMSLPGDTCFLWTGLGIDHHHHEEASLMKEDTTCFHDHDCTPHDKEPEKPCETSDDPLLMVGSGTFKLHPQFPPTGTDVPPAWAKAPGASMPAIIGSSINRTLRGNFNALPPPVEISLCRFLI
jgi:hypothetical protein